MEIQEGDILNIEVTVKDIDDGNMIVFQIWAEGQDPNTHIPYNVMKSTVKNSRAKARWCLQFPDDIPDEDPKYFYTAHSAWCPPIRSELITIKVRRPEITKVACRDIDGNDISSTMVGKDMLFLAEGENFLEGDLITFKIYPNGFDPKKHLPLGETSVPYTAGKAEVGNKYHFEGDPENPPKEKHKFFFTASSARCKAVESGWVEVGMAVDIAVCNDLGERLAELEYTLVGLDGAEEKGKTGKDGRVRSDTLIPGNYEVDFNWEAYRKPEEEAEKFELENAEEMKKFQVVGITKREPVNCKAGIDYLFVGNENLYDLSS